MVKTKRRKSLASLLIALMVAIGIMAGGSANVFADTIPASGTLLWSYFGGNYTGEVITPPAYYDGNVYAVVKDENDAYLKKFDESDGSASDVAKLEGVSLGYNTLAPTIDANAGKIYVPLTGSIAIVPINGGTVEYVSTETGYQTISPITFDNNYLYFGTYLEKDGFTGDYYRVNKSNLTQKKMVEDTAFYWAGACPVTIDGKSYVLFGSNAQKVYLYSNEDEDVVDEYLVDGNVNSTIVADGNGSYFFSARTGYSSGKLYKISITADKKIAVANYFPVPLTKYSTCTPVLVEGNVYVGTAGQNYQCGAVDVFSTNGVKNNDLSRIELVGEVKGLTALNGKVYASYNNMPGGLYNVTEKEDFYVPAESMKQYNAYVPVTNGTDKIFFKNDSGYLMAVSAGESNPGGDNPGGGDNDSSTPDDSDKDTTADVYVTISNKGDLKLAQEKVKVTDVDNDGALTINDALYLAHENNYEGGAEAGYGSSNTEWGLSLIKLWGDTSLGFGYRVNNQYAMSLADTVKDGDYVNAYIYKDQTTWSDVYSWFDQNAIAVKVDEPVTLKLCDDGSLSRSLQTTHVADVTITINGEKTKYKTDENGNVTLSIDKKGTYVISAVSETDTLVPPVCKVTVTEESTDTATKTSDDFNLIGFAIIALSALLTAAAVFRRRRKI